MNKTITYTWADLEAWDLFHDGVFTSAETSSDVLTAGDKIIMLAEKIKAQRLTVAMQAKGE